MRRAFGWLVLAALAGLAAFYLATLPSGLTPGEIAALPAGDAARGERVFWIGGCASCHAAPGAKGEDRLRLGGGRVLATEFGDFVVPNISSDEIDGIGGWTAADLATAMWRGVSPEGRHYYPAFPYASYIRVTPGDVADLSAFLHTLPAVPGAQPESRLRFPFNIRRGIGLWKLAFLNAAPMVEFAAPDPAMTRGQYLVEGPGHCGECHTPRNLAGAMDSTRWLSGAPAAEGTGRVPNITPGDGGIGDWSLADIAYYFESGFTPEFDSVGGAMAEVQGNLSMLPATDRNDIATYLKAIPGHPTSR
ncbi:cytochrome c [uncultured Amaricoccus sp.]|uniref:cytochrome c n=1 Tax=uncultured Amaricoccus sp. TaxID=339341 RepID=UPI0026073B42|nr:cytochrome c [uncultured Amaricoccus sp.]